jgi:glycosyltransferase involved in cell wall biosynthesis
MVDDQEKSEHLKYAKGLIFPVRWEEPFGIALIEALASGCPVFGTPYGSLPEIITQEVGFLSSSAQELSEAIKKNSYLPEICRKHVIENFSSQKMAQDYLKVYQEVIQKKKLGPAPKTRSDFNSKDLLPWN